MLRRIAALAVGVLAGCSTASTQGPRGAGIPAPLSPATFVARQDLGGGPNLYVANGGGTRPRRPWGPGSVTVYGLKRGKLLQTITNGLNQPTFLTIAPDGYLLVANAQPRASQTVGSVQRYAIGAADPSATFSMTYKPRAIALDSAGEIYVCNLYRPIGVYDPTGGPPTRTIGGYESLSRSQAITFDANGNLYVANFPGGYSYPAGNSISVFDSSGNLVQSITQGIEYPRAIAIHSGKLFVANGPPKGIPRLPYGSITIYPLGSTSPEATITNGIHTPDAMAFDNAGTLYVANLNGHSVSEYAPNTVDPTRIISQGAESPSALTIGGQGNLYVANVYANTVTVYAPRRTTPMRTIAEGLNHPVSIAIGP